MDLAEPRIITIGVSYKPDTTDMRNSPALRIIQELIADGYEVYAFDPLVEGYHDRSILETARGADCLVVLVEHTQVREMLQKDWQEIAQAMRTPRILRFYSHF
jgi:UDPglucose 6-dehydrogenase